MTNAITEAHSIERVAEIINASQRGEATGYSGGTDTRDAEVMAGQYAWNAANESGHTCDDSLWAHLEFLEKAGAEFDFSAALENAISRKEASRPDARTLIEFIDEEFHGSQKAFANAQGVAPAQVTQWMKKKFIVVDDVLYSPRRELETGNNPNQKRLRT